MATQMLNHSIFDKSSTSILERSLLINKKRKNLKHSVLWGSLNICLVSILIYDISNTCPYNWAFYTYVEYVLIAIILFNVLYHLLKVIKLSITPSEQISINMEQRKLLGVHETDPSFKIINTPPNSPGNTTLGNTSSLNTTEYSWQSNITPNDSLNYSLSSSWTYKKCNSMSSDDNILYAANDQSTPVKDSFTDGSLVEYIKDKDDLDHYLKNHSQTEKVDNMGNKTQNNTSSMSSFWNYPVVKAAKDMTSFLKTCQYQHSAQSPTKSTKTDDPSSPTNQVLVLEIRFLPVIQNIVALTHWNENLRKWISQTILERIVLTIDNINNSLPNHGLTDVTIGAVGLERLRKTAQTSSVMQFLPSLTTLIPFLEVHPNQEYLERRIRDLAKGGCMSEFKWNGGGRYNGRDWDDSLPTDCAIIMHLLASYMDTQLLPEPNRPDTKPFSGHYYIRTSDKIPILTPNCFFIKQVTEKPPHYRVVVAGKIYEMNKGYNNMFHSILFFLYHVNKCNDGMLGRINLGRAGLNMLWIIDM